MGSKTEKKLFIFILWGPIKNKSLSIVVLNMAKYTFISLIMVDFVPTFSYSTCSKHFLGGQSASNNSQVQKESKYRGPPLHYY